ncbi:hypothetical protein [Micromonospora sp. KC721]|uniref:hypothetical protein n=1 Tax=Micromonospora sp. KC721 TaxID=2530380 RepID=UPI0010529AA2|nr:hypothetical protein [Micromonospora sp. KC721]TDB74591.1 hypothetical protein E1182_18870 [Micromonospora sp. KC721]
MAYQDVHAVIVNVPGAVVIEFEQIGTALRRRARAVRPTTNDTEYGEPFNKAFDQIRSGVDTAVGTFNRIVKQVNDCR